MAVTGVAICMWIQGQPSLLYYLRHSAWHGV
jgi:hypothetical protein